jgi:cell pole-organizing protein PopZ
MCIMSTAQKQLQDEDSIEGILLSIREIMMTDGQAESGAPRTMDDAPVLDLTQLIRENGQIQEIPKPKAPIPESILKEIDKNSIKNKQMNESLAQKQPEEPPLVQKQSPDQEAQSPRAVLETLESQDVFDDQTALNEIADMLEEDLPDVQTLGALSEDEEMPLQDEAFLDLESAEALEPLKTENDDELFSLDALQDHDMFLEQGGEDVTESLLSQSTDLQDDAHDEKALLGGDALALSLRALDQLDVAVAQTRLKPDPLFDQDEVIGTNIPSKSLEDVIVQAVQPYLKAWLNTHLPTIVEQKVQEEIRRLVNKKLGSS